MTCRVVTVAGSLSLLAMVADSCDCVTETWFCKVLMAVGLDTAVETTFEASWARFLCSSVSLIVLELACRPVRPELFDNRGNSFNLLEDFGGTKPSLAPTFCLRMRWF